MRQLRAIAIYAIAVAVLGPLLAPWLYWGGTWLADAGLLKNYPFHRYFNRAVMLVAFAGLWPLVRNLGLKRWADIGLMRRKGGCTEFGAGFAAGFASIALLAIAAAAAGAQQWKQGLSLTAIWNHAAAALATGLVVGLLEETFFRGVAYCGLRRSLAVAPALLVTSVFYSVVHFIKPSPVPPDYVVNWWSGLELLLQCGCGSVGTPAFWPYFTTLVLAGVILAWSLEKTGALYLPIGLHAGWVFALQLNPRLFKGTGVAASWFGDGRLENGWLGAPLLAVVFTVLVWRLRDSTSERTGRRGRAV